MCGTKLVKLWNKTATHNQKLGIVFDTYGGLDCLICILLAES